MMKQGVTKDVGVDGGDDVGWNNAWWGGQSSIA